MPIPSPRGFVFGRKAQTPMRWVSQCVLALLSPGEPEVTWCMEGEKRTHLLNIEGRGS